MMEDKSYLTLDKLETYILARDLGRVGWKIYQSLDWRTKKINGDQFIEATDSVGANVAEGYGRFHFLDKVKFYYNARASLLESRHWFDIMTERKIIEDEKFIEEYLNCYVKVGPKLNALINSALKFKNQK